MADPRNNPAPNRAFVPPWQLRPPNQTVAPLPGRSSQPAASSLGHSVNASSGAPPVTPRNHVNSLRRHFQSPFSGALSSSFGLPSFSAYSSPFYGSYPSSRPPGLFDAASTHPFPHSAFQSAFQSASPALEGVESLVLTVRSISIMVESTYQALHSSFCVILGVADHFSKLKDHLVSILSKLSLLRLFKWILDRFSTVMRLKQRRRSRDSSVADSSVDWTDQFAESAASASSLTSIASGSMASSLVDSRRDGATSSPHWPVIAFFGLALGAPWLLWKMVSTAQAAAAADADAASEDDSSASDSASASAATSDGASSSAENESSSWSRGVGEHFVAKAEFDYRATAEDEISFLKDDLLKIAPKRLQRGNPKGWYSASKDGRRVGLIPANHVEVLVKLEGKSRET